MQSICISVYIADVHHFGRAVYPLTISYPCYLSICNLLIYHFGLEDSILVLIVLIPSFYIYLSLTLTFCAFETYESLLSVS